MLSSRDHHDSPDFADSTAGKAKQPIGIFDSGVGGLTVTKAIVDLMPHENIIYFGDTAHLPYGDKSAATICTYALKIAAMLLEKKCKMLVIACNSISAAAHAALTEHVRERALLLNVIDPVVAYLGKHYTGKTIGLIGTRQTVQSGVYEKKLQALSARGVGEAGGESKKVTLRALATPLLVPIIEEGFNDDHPLVTQALREYLGRAELQNIAALVLGCTHYPLIKSSILQYYKNAIEIIDASSLMAQEVKQHLTKHNLLNGAAVNHTANQKINHFYISDYTEVFAHNAKLFFGDNIELRRHALWD